MKHYKLVEFLSTLNVKAPGTNLKPPSTNVKSPIDDFLATVLLLTLLSALSFQCILRNCVSLSVVVNIYAMI